MQWLGAVVLTALLAGCPGNSAQPTPTSSPSPIVGTWQGVLLIQQQQQGQSPVSETEHSTFAVESGTGSSVVLWLDPNHKDPRCKIVGEGAGTRVVFQPQTVCTVASATMSVRSGSLELQGTDLLLQLELGSQAPGTAPALMTYSGTARRAP